MHLSTHPTQARAGYFNPAWLLEFLLTLGVGYFLFMLAQPLASIAAQPDVVVRYLQAQGWSDWPMQSPLSWSWFEVNWQQRPVWRSALPQDVRAILLLHGAGYSLAMLAGVGWLALQLARTGSVWGAGLVLALWAAGGWLLQPFGQATGVWLGLVALGLLIAATALPFWPWSRQASAALQTSGQFNLWIACIWPGWLLFTGVGVLTAIDFAAHGPLVPDGMALRPAEPGARYFGLRQIDGLWAACAVLFYTVNFSAPLLRAWVRLCNNLAGLYQRPRGPYILLLLALLLAFGLGWLGFFPKRNFLGIPGLHGAGKSHFSGELLRLMACVALAWFAYRVGEWRTSPQRTWLSLRGLLLVGLLCGLALGVSEDNGPLLILALALPLLLGAPLLQRVQGSRVAMLLAAVLALLMVFLWRSILVDWLPQVSDMAAARDFLRTHLFDANSPNLAQARWLMDATPPSGFGLARVPYCGARAWVGQGVCTLGSGAHLQMPSDMAYAMLVATLGRLCAALLLVVLLIWLAALPAGQLAAWRATLREPVGHHQKGQSAHTLRGLWPVWLVAVPSLAAQAQTLVSFGATLGWSSLAGVTLPLLGFGSTALCVSAVWVGFAAGARCHLAPKPAYLT